jgi:hypothetical protein
MDLTKNLDQRINMSDTTPRRRTTANIRLKEIFKKGALFGNQSAAAELLTGSGALANSGASPQDAVHNLFFLKLL